MSFLERRHRGVVATLLASALVTAATTAGGAVAAPAGGAGGTVDRAIVALTGSTAVTVPGVRVVALLPAVHSEIVTGTAAGLARLAADPRVLGLRRDAAVPMAGHHYGARGSVLAWQDLGGRAGRPDAGSGVTVAMIDTGVSDTPALNRASGRLVDGVDTSPLVNLHPPLTSGVFADGYGHGTFLATLLAGGPVAGTGDRGLGVAPGVTVEVVKVATANGRTSLSAVLAGLNWVALHHSSIQVANLALGLPTSGQWGADPLNLATEWVRDAGVLVVAAAGNTPHQVTDPGFDPRVVTAGAADTRTADPSVAPFSGSGTIAGVAKPDVVAAGTGMLGMLPSNSVIARQHPNARQANGLWRGSGTSEATAVTSGVAAMYYADHPGASPLEVKTALREAARPMADRAAGAGLLQIPAQPGSRGPDADTGEAGFQPVAWVSSPWAAASWAAASWAAASWARAASWAGDSFDAASWASDWWRAASWAAASWARAASWAAASWAAASWAAASWAAASWAGGYWGDAGATR